ncbi:hypothetical protein CLV43_108358 [Umezawaea tangerina]|uniref:Uncharacterized protein n=1 Tax=Umezawaea tangerina TaxID=84725 RepID=A0A2T0SZW1_9PSEU|nr:hypothetical protein CLV43_108358 [Umezawaea tangerina]
MGASLGQSGIIGSTGWERTNAVTRAALMSTECLLSTILDLAYSSSLARESAMSRLHMVSCPIRSTGLNAESSVRSTCGLSGWYGHTLCLAAKVLAKPDLSRWSAGS